MSWTLTPTANGGTRVRMEHTGFQPQSSFAYHGLTRGWNDKVLPALRALITKLD